MEHSALNLHTRSRTQRPKIIQPEQLEKQITPHSIFCETGCIHDYYQFCLECIDIFTYNIIVGKMNSYNVFKYKFMFGHDFTIYYEGKTYEQLINSLEYFIEVLKEEKNAESFNCTPEMMRKDVRLLRIFIGELCKLDIPANGRTIII